MSTDNGHNRYRVAHIITRLIRGGADRVVLDCIANLDHDRFQVDLMVGGQSELDWIEVPREVDRLVFIPTLVRDLNPVYDLSALWAIYRKIKERQYDIVHTHTAKAGFLGRLAAHLAGTPYVVHHLHGITFPPGLPWISRKFYIGLERLAAGWTDSILPVGHDLSEVYQRNKIGKTEQYHVIHYPIRLAPFINARSLPQNEVAELRAALGIQPDDLVIGNVGRLVKGKGFRYYIEAAKQVAGKHPNLKFLIVGEGPLRRPLERRISKNGLADRIIFTGFRTDVHKVMALFDIFAFTSLWEGVAQVMVQSAALGKPIVTFSVEGARELVHDCQNGYIVPSKDVDALADRLDELCSRPELRAQMSRSMVQTFHPEDWSIDVVVRKLALLYEHNVGQTGQEAQVAK